MFPYRCSSYLWQAVKVSAADVCAGFISVSVVDALRLPSFWLADIKHWGWLPQAICSVSHIIHARWISHRLIYNWNWTNTKCVPLRTVWVRDCVVWHRRRCLGSHYRAETLQPGGGQSSCLFSLRRWCNYYGNLRLSSSSRSSGGSVEFRASSYRW